MDEELNRIHLLEPNDFAFGVYLDMSIKYMDSYDDNREYTDVNDVIELDVVRQIISNKVIRPELVEKYKSLMPGIQAKVAKFFNTISDENFLSVSNSVSRIYTSEFWYLFEKYKCYKKVSPEIFKKYLSTELINIHDILANKEIVKEYDVILADFLRDYALTPEMIIDKFMSKGTHAYYFPISLKKTEYEEIISKYIDSEHPSIGRLQAVEKYLSADGIIISDKVRLRAGEKAVELINKKDIIKFNQNIGISVSFRDIEDEIFITKPISSTEHQIVYSEKWISENLDYPTLLNNFIYLFGFVDIMNRCSFVSIASKMGTLESHIGVKGIKEYEKGIFFLAGNLKADADLGAYIKELKKFNIRLEDIFQWFFNDYLKEEFGIGDFVFNAPSASGTQLEKCRNLPAEMDGVIKQYSMYLEDGKIDRRLFEMSSNPVSISKIPSQIKNKYAYANSEKIKKEVFALFSDQCMLSYVEKYGSQYGCLYDLLKNERVNILDYRENYKESIEWLRERGCIFIDDDGYISLNKCHSFLLKELYDYEVLCLQYYKEKELVDEYKNMILQNDIYVDDTLLSKPEQKYFNYVLNKSEFSDSLDLRNKYIHSTYPVDEKVQEHDYLQLLKLMIILIIKINEEFCLKNQ